jgi:serine protease Do
MKKLAIQCMFILLIIIIAMMGFFIAGQNSQLENTKSQISDLFSEVSALQSEQSYGVTITNTSTTDNLIPVGDLLLNIQPVIIRLDITGAGFSASGSGIIIKNNGYVITNEHVIHSAVTITVTLDNGQCYPAKVVDMDTDLDLAILEFDSQAVLPVASFGSWSDIVVGETVVAAGFPMGKNLPGPVSFTQGIISAIRKINGNKYIQCDAQIIPGNSGGALIAKDNGKVIGITSARISPNGDELKGFGIAIPVDIVQSYIQTILD